MNSTKGRRYPPEVLSRAEVLSIINACPSTSTGRRNAALIALLYRCGLRLSEALDLQLKDVDMDTGIVRVLHGKGDRARTVGIDSGAVVYLRDWLEVRPTVRGAPLFCTMQGGRIQTPYIRALLPKLAAQAGVSKRVHAHGFRHTHAYELAMEGVPMHIIRRQLGHSSLATTDKYISHLAPAEVIDTIKSRSW